LGRPHVYKAKRYYAKLERLVSCRNKAVHTRRDADQTPLSVRKREAVEAVQQVASMLPEMAEQHAVAHFAVVTHRTEDAYGRVEYRLKLDDQGVREIASTVPLTLGAAYAYLGGGGNPKPVDPILVPMDDLRL
jgi:hypothetical protein